jgi:arylsulfatase A-like enzyme
MFHGQSTYGELTDAALVLWGSRAVPRGVVIGETVETIDLMPTLLDIGGLPAPEGIQGRSLVPLLAAGLRRPARADQAVAGPGSAPPEGWADRPAISEKARTSLDAGGSPPPRDTESTAITLGGWKLIRNTHRPEGTPEYELYDARKDPLNRKDLAAGHPDVVEALARELAAWKSRAAAARLKPDSEAAASLSPEELERLRSLGYIQ